MAKTKKAEAGAGNSSLPLSEEMIHQYATNEIFQRGLDYYYRGAVVSLVRRGQTLEAEVEGSEIEPYVVSLNCAKSWEIEASCTCPYDWGGWCKHIVAAALAAVRDGQTIEARPPLHDALARLDRAQLHDLLLWLVAQHPRLTESIERRLSVTVEATATPGGASAVDPAAIKREARSILRRAERWRMSEGNWPPAAAGDGLTPSLQQAEQYLRTGRERDGFITLGALTESYMEEWEQIIEGVYEDEETPFLIHLGQTWTEALLSVDLTRREREDWADTLALWQKALGEYGYDDIFTAAREAARQGWDAPDIKRVLQGASTREQPPRQPEAAPWGGAYLDPQTELIRARLGVLERQGRTEEYLRLARAEGQVEAYATALARDGRTQEAFEYGLSHLQTPKEALALAQTLLDHGARERALQIAEHSLTLHEESGALGPLGARARLATWLRETAVEGGETERASRAALVAFREERSLVAYQRLAELAGDQWAGMREGLLDELRSGNGYNRHGPVEILLSERRLDDAIRLVEGSAPHELVERVVDVALERQARLDWVIATCRAQAEPIMDGGKSQYYGAAARWVAKARSAYALSGREPEWQAYRADILALHRRKYALRPLLEAIV